MVEKLRKREYNYLKINPSVRVKIGIRNFPSSIAIAIVLKEGPDLPKNLINVRGKIALIIKFKIPTFSNVLLGG